MSGFPATARCWQESGGRALMASGCRTVKRSANDCMIKGMKPPVLVRALTDEERRQLVAGLRSSDAFVLRHCQVLLASAQGKPVKDIAAPLGCAT